MATTKKKGPATVEASLSVRVDDEPIVELVATAKVKRIPREVAEKVLPVILDAIAQKLGPLVLVPPPPPHDRCEAVFQVGDRVVHVDAEKNGYPKSLCGRVEFLLTKSPHTSDLVGVHFEDGRSLPVARVLYVHDPRVPRTCDHANGAASPDVPPSERETNPGGVSEVQ